MMRRILSVLIIILKSLLYLVPIALIVFLYLFVATFNDMNIYLRCGLYYGDLILLNLLIIVGDSLSPNKLDKETDILSNFGIVTVQFISLLLFVSKFHFEQFDGYWITFVLILYFLFGMLIVIPLLGNDSKLTFSKGFIKNALFYIFGDLLYISLFKFDIHYIIIFGVITFVLIFTTIVRVVVSERKIDVSFIIDCLLALIILVVTIWKIPLENNLQSIVLQLSAALLGGIITMLGVVLTIKNADNQRSEDRKEQLKPLIFINSIDNVKGLTLSGKEMYFINGIELNSDNDNVYKLNSFVIQNSDASYPIIHGIVINHKNLFRFTNPTVLSKNQNLIVNFKNSIPVISNKVTDISLCTSDINNKHFYLLDLKYSKCNVFTYVISAFEGFNREIQIINEEKDTIETIEFVKEKNKGGFKNV